MSIVTRDRILAIRALMQWTMERVNKELPKIYSKELVELLFWQPYTKGRFLVEAGIAERKTASTYLHELERIGVLEAQKMGTEVLYLNTKLYDLLLH
jgi:Fic family protein